MPGPRRAVLPALLVLLAAAGPAGAQEAPPGFTDGARTMGDRLVPGVGNGGYDVAAYRLDLRYTARTRSLAGTAEVDATATQDLRSLSLDLVGLRVSAVRIGGAAAPFSQTRRKLVITPPGGVAAGTAFIAAIDYRGRPRSLHSRFTGLTGWTPTRGGAFVASEPAGSRTWFPVNDRPDDKATFALRMSVPRGLGVIANGSLRSRSTAGGRTTFAWAEDRPVQPYLDTANIGRFEVLRGTSASGLALYSGIERGRGGVAGFRAIAPFKPARAAEARRVLRRAGATIDRLATIFGPYPFGSGGGVLRRSFPLRYALETSSRPSYYDLLDPEVQAHELAHQWFGNTVTLTQWRDIWLHEGFATWAQWWFTHERDPRRATVAQRAARVYRTPPRIRGRVADVWQPVIPRRGQDLFGRAVYERGGVTLEALRQRVGDAVFRQILQTWVAEHRYANATTAQFVELAQRISGQDLGPFFEDWLDERGKPTTTPPRAGF